MARKTIRALSTTQEEIDKINPDNRELMEDFYNYLEATDHAKTSIVVYKSNLNIFFVYVMKNCKNKDFKNITKRDLMNFQTHLMKLELSPSRIKVLRSSISSMSLFIENVLDEEEKWKGFKNIVNKIPAPNSAKVREKTILSEEECQRLLTYLVETKQYQKACIFALAFSSGRRKTELMRIKRSHIVEENLLYGSLYKTPEKIKTKGKGKGKMLNLYVLQSKFKPYFDLWMEERKRLGVPDDIDEIFVSKKKGEWVAMKPSTLDSWSKKFSEFLGVDFYFHCMRHNFTTYLHENKIPASVIKEIIGWESLELVTLYTDTNVDSELGKYFSKEGIKRVEDKSIEDL